MANNLKMEVILQAIDRATRPIRAVTQGSVGLGRALKESRDQLKQLQATQSDVSSWQRLRAISANTETALQGARDRVKELGRQMAATGAPTKQMTADMQDAIRAATTLKKHHQEQQAELQGLRNKLSAAGISTRNLVQGERELRDRIANTNQQISEQTQRMQRLAAQSKRLATARAQYDKTQQLAGSMAGAGAGAGIRGAPAGDHVVDLGRYLDHLLGDVLHDGAPNPNGRNRPIARSRSISGSSRRIGEAPWNASNPATPPPDR